MEKNNFSFFRLGVFLVGIFSAFTILDFSLNYLLLSFIAAPTPGQLIYGILRVWPYIYMAVGFSIAIFFVVSLILLLVKSNFQNITGYIILMIIGFVLLGVGSVYYPFIEWIIDFVGESSKETLFRLIYYIGSIVTYILLMIAWSGFKKGYKNSGVGVKVTGSITALQVGNIIALCTHFIFAVMYILLRLIPPSSFIFQILVIPLYVFAYAYPILFMIGYMALSREFVHMKPSEMTPEPTLGYTPPPAKAPEPEYQHPKDHVCPNCGSKLALNTPYCPFCGSSTK